MRDDKIFGLLALLLIAAAAAALWYYRTPHGATAPPAPPPPAEPRAEPPGGPRYPLPQDDSQAGQLERDLRPLPALDQSDGYFRLELVDLLGPGSGELIVESGLIERIVATVDNLPRQRIAERIRPLAALPGRFTAEGQDDSGQYLLGESNFRRYDGLVEQFAGVDMQRALEVYRRYYPLFQKAYVGLGYPDGYFNDRLVEVIDHLLATPEVAAPIELVRPNVLYEFADPELEALSGGQKLMLRLGPSNRRRVREKLEEMRALVVAE